MKTRPIITGLIVLLLAGCDTLEADKDLDAVVNNQPAYLLADGSGFIDLASRVVAKGTVRVEITSQTHNGELVDFGGGLLQYKPGKGSLKDSFQFNVYRDGALFLDKNTIDIILTNDSTSLPCQYVYTRNDSATNVSGPVTVDVTENDYSCSTALTISVNVGPQHGTASVVGNKILYTPNSSFTGRDQLLYKAISSDPSTKPGYAMLWLIGKDTTVTDTTTTTPCAWKLHDDTYFRPKNDSTLLFLDVLANDTTCSDAPIVITKEPSFGTAGPVIRNGTFKIAYKTTLTQNSDDTLMYRVGNMSGVARVFIKRQ